MWSEIEQGSTRGGVGARVRGHHPGGSNRRFFLLPLPMRPGSIAELSAFLLAGGDGWAAHCPPKAAGHVLSSQSDI